MKLYTLTDNLLTTAPTFVTIDGVPYSQPTQATLRRAGIEAYPKEIDPPMPPEEEGKIVVPNGYALVDGAWVKQWCYEDAPPPPPVVYSKYKLVRALQAENVWDRVKAWLEATPGAYDLYLAAEDISGDEQILSDGIAAAKEAFGWTDEKVQEILAEAAT
jgi:hypothetical protein